jgi:hypothetical protein
MRSVPTATACSFAADTATGSRRRHSGHDRRVAPPATSTAVPIRPRGAWYLAAIAVMVIGAYLSIHNGVSAVRNFGDDYHELKPGVARSLPLPRNSTQSVYAVSADDKGGSSFSFDSDSTSTTSTELPTSPSGSSSLRPVTKVVVTGPDGASVPFRASTPATASRWSLDEKSGIKVGDFRTGDAGRYRVTVTFEASASGATPPARAAIAEFHIGRTLRAVILPVTIGVLAGLVMIVVLAVLRGGAKRRRALARVEQDQYAASAEAHPPTAPGETYRPPAPPPPLSGSGDGGPIQFH